MRESEEHRSLAHRVGEVVGLGIPAAIVVVAGSVLALGVLAYVALVIFGAMFGGGPD